MKIVKISVDCSCHMDEINKIKNVIDWRVIPILKYHFDVVKFDIEDVFIAIYLDVEKTTMDYSDIVNYCDHLVQYMLIDKWDLIIATYTSSL